MNRRRDVEDRRWRVAFLVSLGVALVAHASLGIWNPTFEIAAPESEKSRIRLEVRLGVPEIHEGSAVGRAADPPVEIEVARTPGLPELIRHWPPAYRAYSVGGSAALRIRLDDRGRVEDVRILESSGDPLKDEAFRHLASSLRYRPFAPDLALEHLEVVQPMTVAPLPHAVEVVGAPR